MTKDEKAQRRLRYARSRIAAAQRVIDMSEREIAEIERPDRPEPQSPPADADATDHDHNPLEH